MFNPERDLRLAILEILREEGKSISAISRELEKRGYSQHRLILTGYLRAMTDLNVLKEREVLPAKVYIAYKGREQSIYELVGEKVRQLYGEGSKCDQLILYALNGLLHRAVFSDEISKAGVKTSPGHEASKEERQTAKQALMKSGFKVPDSLKAFVIEAPELEKQRFEVITRLIADLYNISFLVKETKQTRLTF